MQASDITDRFLAMTAEAKELFLSALPRVATAALILLVGWVLATVLRRVVRRILRRLVRRLPPGSTRADWTEAMESPDTGNVAANGVYWLVLLTAVMVAIDALGLTVVGKWISAFAGYLPRLFIALALLVAGILAGRLARNAVVRAAVRLPSSQGQAFGRLTQISIVAAAALIAADQLGVDVSLLTSIFLIALAGALAGGAIAFGLGSRDLVADILAMHYVQKSHRVGELVRIGSDEGRIVRTTRTTVVLESAEGEVSIPGRDFTSSRCVLLSRVG